ncbi:GNAT family N-acetyltransferase [Mammaliicoccus sciuri]|uniref:GNAT family N-acetyltransferase n=1 Tax=Mammaliicoccus sciuri TaxID=1296 RepID=UPI00195005EE
MYDIKIDESERGKGLGKMTMQALDEYCKEHDIKSIRLHVFGHNQIAYELYKKMGFETTNYYMEKAL